jgi:hypothetical protein
VRERGDTGRFRGAARGAGAVTAGFLVGLVVGAVAWTAQIRRSRRDLFSTKPVRRLAALGYLGRRPGPETAHLLHDYVAWERRPALRRRGERLLRRMYSHLE